MRWIFLILTLLPLSANANNWVKVVINEDRDEYFVDTNSLLRIGNIQSYWEKANFSKTTRHGDMSSLGNFKINCDTNEYQTVVISFFKELDNVGSKQTIYPKLQEWKPIKSDTVHASIMNFVCKR